MTPFQSILRTVSADRTSLFFTLPLFFSVDSPVFARRKRSARSASIGVFRACRYEGVTRYIETEGDASFFLFFFYSCLFFAPNSRTQEAATSGEIEKRTDDFNRPFFNNITLLVTSIVKFFLFLSLSFFRIYQDKREIFNEFFSIYAKCRKLNFKLSSILTF